MLPHRPPPLCIIEQLYSLRVPLRFSVADKLQLERTNRAVRKLVKVHGYRNCRSLLLWFENSVLTVVKQKPNECTIINKIGPGEWPAAFSWLTDRFSHIDNLELDFSADNYCDQVMPFVFGLTLRSINITLVCRWAELAAKLIRKNGNTLGKYSYSSSYNNYCFTGDSGNRLDWREALLNEQWMNVGKNEGSLHRNWTEICIYRGTVVHLSPSYKNFRMC